MKLKHTALFALSLNVRVIDPAGRDAGALIAPVLYFWLWIPGWLWGWWVTQETTRRSRIAGSGAEGLHHHNRRGELGRYLAAWRVVLFGPGWRDDLRLIGLAAWLLIRERGFYGAPI